MIRAVYRVQCDGCKGWLSRSDDYVVGTVVEARHEVVRPTAEKAFNWPGERAARIAAAQAGWVKHPHQLHRWLCPDCKTNPLGVTLPPWPDHPKGN